MGSLTPGATYIYERSGEEIYAREVGKTERKLIGYQYENKIDPRTNDGRPLYEHIKEDKLWSEIRFTAKQDIILQNMLNEVEVYFKLKKPNA